MLLRYNILEGSICPNIIITPFIVDTNGNSIQLYCVIVNPLHYYITCITILNVAALWIGLTISKCAQMFCCLLTCYIKNLRFFMLLL